MLSIGETAVETPKHRKRLRLLVPSARTLRRLPWFGVIVLSVALFLAVFAPWLAPHSSTAGYLTDSLQPPGSIADDASERTYWLGTDYLGRDVLSRLIVGSRLTLMTAGLGVVTSTAVGTLLGLIAAYSRGKLDTLIMGAVDVSLALPPLVLALALAVAIGAGLWNMIIVMNLVYWSRFARQARGEGLAVMAQDYVLASRAIGATMPHILVRHVLPNIVGSIAVLGSLILGQLILLEATLSFLGVGIPPPAPSWGNMVSEGRAYVADAPWMIIPPGVAMLLIVLAVNLLGDWTRDRLDPRLEHST